MGGRVVVLEDSDSFGFSSSSTSFPFTARYILRISLCSSSLQKHREKTTEEIHYSIAGCLRGIRGRAAISKWCHACLNPVTLPETTSLRQSEEVSYSLHWIIKLYSDLPVTRKFESGIQKDSENVPFHWHYYPTGPQRNNDVSGAVSILSSIALQVNCGLLK